MKRIVNIFIFITYFEVVLSMSLVKPQYFCSNVTITSTLKHVVTIVGKTYFADPTPMNWEDARSYCKSLGLRLASITSVAQSKALSGPHPSDFSGLHWTSGRDSYLARQFTWDSTSTAVSSDYPEFTTTPSAYQTCLAYVMTPGTPHLTHAPCTDAYKVLCEATG